MRTAPYVETKRMRLEKMRGQLRSEREPFMAYWRDLASYILPRSPRFLVTDVNKSAGRVNSKINDGTATLAARTLAANMMAWITSPSRPWLRVNVQDPDLAELDDVKAWCFTVTQRILAAFNRGRVYNSLAVMYKEMPTFGQAPVLIEEDLEHVLRTTVFPPGSFMVARGERGTVNMFCREYRMTVRQMIEAFSNSADPDWTKFSDHVRSLWEDGMRETWVDICHQIYPNQEYSETKRQARYKRFASCYYEAGYSGVREQNYLSDTDQEKFLRESGYDYFPVLCPAWEVTGEDSYASDCPGMTALPDVKSLQVNEKRCAQAIEKTVNPPMIAPVAMRQKRVSMIAGDVTFMDVPQGQDGIKPLYQFNPPIGDLEEKSQQARERIKRAYFEDLFLMMALDPKTQPVTAREVEERHEEKLLALGPVLERLNSELLDPLVDITFKIMWDQGLIPPPPEAIKGADLKIEYISLMAQAQVAAGAGNLQEFLFALGQLASLKPSALDALNEDEFVYALAETRGLDPALLRSEDEVLGMREARAKLQAQQAMTEAIPAGAKAVKDLASAESGNGTSVLGNLANAVRDGQIDPAAGAA